MRAGAGNGAGLLGQPTRTHICSWSRIPRRPTTTNPRTHGDLEAGAVPMARTDVGHSPNRGRDHVHHVRDDEAVQLSANAPRRAADSSDVAVGLAGRAPNPPWPPDPPPLPPPSPPFPPPPPACPSPL